MTNDEVALRQAIGDACRMMNAIGINQGTSGNISARYGDTMLVTPSGVPYADLTPESIAAMPLKGDYGTWTGPLKPSTEWRFHLDIMRARPEVGAIVHTHSTYATVLAIARKEIPACHYMIAASGGPTIRCGDYATYGTKELSEAAFEGAGGPHLLPPGQSRDDRHRGRSRQGDVAGGRARDDRQAVLSVLVHRWARRALGRRDRQRQGAVQVLRPAGPGAGQRRQRREGGEEGEEKAQVRPLADWPLEARRRVDTVLTDIDDTLTHEGRLPAEAYAALERLRSAGFRVVPITGRPAGWCDHIARMWPVDGVVGENGAFWFRYDETERRLVRRFLVDDATRAANRRRLDDLAGRILAAVPGTALASDQLYREADLAIDFCEDVPPLPAAEVRRIVGLFEAAGATAKVSSIHVNGWFGSYDKLTMTRIFMEEAFGVELDAALDRFVFVGDSPNDQPMFAHFPNAVGVANIRRFAADLTHPPVYVAKGHGGPGFAEVTDALLQARRLEPIDRKSPIS